MDFSQLEFDEVSACGPAPESAARLATLRAELEETREDLDALDESIRWLRAELRSLNRTQAPAPRPGAVLQAVLSWRTAAAFLGSFVAGLLVFR